MDQPRSLAMAEIRGALETLLLAVDYQDENDYVLTDGIDQVRMLLVMDAQWDMPRGDVEEILRANNISVADFWDAYHAMLN